MQQILPTQGHTSRLFITRTAMAVALCMAAYSQSAVAGFKVGDTTEINIGGYVKLDAMLTDTSDGQIATGIGREFYVPSLTPVGGTGESATWDMHARQSRFLSAATLCWKTEKRSAVVLSLT